ncbi:hypothetical protein DIPPA_13073 [Diplonema papillatum]|nr:hypothetical protein DIPPA_13908 [Diplonema papillatum]KAJ9469065.1 hypothetical protein DIPPA_13073 [Diplonema papillatum]
MEACHGAAVEKTIGVKVADVMARAEQRTRDYPSLPYQCIKWLAVHGLDSASLFDPPLPEAREHSMGQEDLAELGLRHTAGMLVSFIKDIPRGLFAASFDELMRAAADLCVAEEAAADAVPATERVHTALSHLPSEHLALCTDLFLFLHQLCLNPGAGGVRLSVLSDRFAPQIFPYSSSRNATAEATLVGYLISQSSAEFWERIWDLVE